MKWSHKSQNKCSEWSTLNGQKKNYWIESVKANKRETYAQIIIK